MRLVIDLQSLQTISRQRGVGRYTVGLTKAMLQGAGRHEIVLALNGRDPEGVRAARRDFAGLLPPERIRAWQAPEFGSWAHPSERWRNRAAELAREYFLANLDADAVHVSAIFEGFFADATTSIGLLGRQPPVGAILYDLTPLRIPDICIPDGPVRDWYLAKLRHMSRASRWLAISEATRRDGIDFLGLNPAHVVNISAGVDPKFAATRGATDGVKRLARERDLQQGFILYYGGLDVHKNVARLVDAYAMLPAELRRDRPLVIVGEAPHPTVFVPIEEAVARARLTEREVRFLGRVDDSDLVSLLHACTFSIYPSLMEGFGLPVLEAMSAGAAVLCSNTSSLPEVIGRADATFDPLSATSIAERMSEVLKDDAFRAELQAFGPERAKLFTWANSARKAIEAYESLHDEERVRKRGTRALAGWLPPRTRLAWLADWPLSTARAAGVACLAKTYEVDLFVESAVAASEVVAASAPLFGIETFPHLAASYDRVVIDRADAQAWLACGPAVVVRRRGNAGARDHKGRLNLLGFIAEPVDPPTEDSEGDIAAWAEEATRLIEDAHVAAASPTALARAFAACVSVGAGEAYDRDFAATMAANRPPVGPPRLLIEVSRALASKVRSGIVRVTSEIVRALLVSPPLGVEIVPVRFFPEEARVVRASDFYPHFRNGSAGADREYQEIELQVGDRLLALGLNHDLADSELLLRRLRELGGQAHAIVYDLLPLQRPDWFHPEVQHAHRHWFDAISGWDGLVCISQAVAQDVRSELRRLGRDKMSPEPSWFHLGGDFAEPAHAEPLPELAGRRTILHVSVVWARKGHEQTLKAFETLWAAGIDANYVIVGRSGYGVDGLIKRLRNHPERGKRLHWFEDCDDAVLARLYATADGVLVPSEAEGFGLPLIEAIHHHRPVLCRDLPVFRELAGDEVRYFEGLDAASLAAALRSWLVDLASGAARPATGVRLLSWQESAAQLLSAIGLAPARSEPEAAISRTEVRQLSQ